MNRPWHWLKNSVTQDDLFLRVLFFLLGTVLGGGGLYGLFWLGASGLRGEPMWLKATLASLAAFFAVWGALLVMRTFARAGSRAARLAEKLAPESADEGALVIIVLFGMPAVLVTILLRLAGVHGQVNVPSGFVR